MRDATEEIGFSVTKDEIDIRLPGLEEFPDTCGGCMVAEALKGLLVRAGTGGGGIITDGLERGATIVAERGRA